MTWLFYAPSHCLHLLFLRPWRPTLTFSMALFNVQQARVDDGLRSTEGLWIVGQLSVRASDHSKLRVRYPSEPQYLGFRLLNGPLGLALGCHRVLRAYAPTPPTKKVTTRTRTRHDSFCSRANSTHYFTRTRAVSGQHPLLPAAEYRRIPTTRRRFSAFQMCVLTSLLY